MSNTPHGEKGVQRLVTSRNYTDFGFQNQNLTNFVIFLSHRHRFLFSFRSHDKIPSQLTTTTTTTTTSKCQIQRYNKLDDQHELSFC